MVKPFLALRGAIARAEEPVGSPETSTLLSSAYWACILHCGLNCTMDLLFSLCTSRAGKGYSVALWALTGAKRMDVGVGQ